MNTSTEKRNRGELSGARCSLGSARSTSRRCETWRDAYSAAINLDLEITVPVRRLLAACALAAALGILLMTAWAGEGDAQAKAPVQWTVNRIEAEGN